jgi:hypothetical protein
VAYDAALADRFREALKDQEGISEMRMMGGMCFFAHGNMIGGADRTKDGRGRFMFRVGKPASALAEQLPGAEPAMMGSRRMSGFYFVGEEHCGPDGLAAWVALALKHALALPAK